MKTFCRMRRRVFFAALSLIFVGAVDAKPPASASPPIQEIVIGSDLTTTVNGKSVQRYPDLGEVFTVMPKPDYPQELRRLRIQGSGSFRVYTNEQGTVTAVKVHRSTGNKALDDQAYKALRCWQAKPGPRREIDVPITFALHRA